MSVNILTEFLFNLIINMNMCFVHSGIIVELHAAIEVDSSTALKSSLFTSSDHNYIAPLEAQSLH